MAAPTDNNNPMPVIKDIKDFNSQSGNYLERLVFNHRRLMVLVCFIITVVLGLLATRLVVNAGYEKMLPQSHPYVKNYMLFKENLRGLGNAVRVVVENTQGTIYDPEYLETLRQVNDTIFLMPGVDRAFMKSLWTPLVRWTEVTEEGFVGGPVMPMAYNGDPESVDQLKINVARAGLRGSLVSTDMKSSMVFVPLLEKNMETGQRIDYGHFSNLLEENIRSKELVTKLKALETPHVKIHIIGFAKLVGDLINGLVQVMTYFVFAAAIVALIIFYYTRCVRSTILVVACSLVAVTWQLGLVNLFGFELDPYSVLVPFLVFAIGVSHGAQKMNGIMQDVGRGTHRYIAARYTFRRLFLAGLTALMADAVGFGVLMFIDIPVIRDLAMTASIGVAVLVFTNLLLLPVLLSFIGVSQKAALRSLQEESAERKGRGLGVVWGFLDRFTERKWAIIAISASVVLAAVGYVISLDLQIGDLDPGAPELRSDSRYNKDNAYITANYALSSDQFAVIVRTPAGTCDSWTTSVDIDKFERQLRLLPFVINATSAVDSMKLVTAGAQEGNPKWMTLTRDPRLLGEANRQVATNQADLVDNDCSVMPIIIYLKDHKADTLDTLVKTVETFAASHNDPAHREFLLAAGSAGMEAATNIVVKQTNRTMLFYVYGAVILLCFITFRNWRAVIVAIVPLVITSILCEALMVILGIGVKVATLPVIALGVGIGVDYALYLLSVQLLAQKKLGLPLKEAYKLAVQFTGKVVALVGITLAAGVITWAWSPIKFQADMGILLAFMFLWNMVGALVLIPALSHFLLNDKKGALQETPSADSDRVDSPLTTSVANT